MSCLLPSVWWHVCIAGTRRPGAATGYDLSEDDVRAAVAYEEQFRSLAA